MKSYHFECVNCSTVYELDEVSYLCPVCELKNTSDTPPMGVLKLVYNYDDLIASDVSFDDLEKNNFLDILPIEDATSFPNLAIGNTPLYDIDSFKLPFNLFLKDDSQNPTYSFKDRASSLVSAYAKENGIDTIVTASTGNAGSSLAGICASQNQRAIIIVPESAPMAKLSQILMYGATIIPIKGTYDDAFDLSIEATNKFGWYNRNTAFNPLTIEGKKTVAFEIYKQMNHQVPDRIFVPVGDGVIISGIYKGFEDLLKLGIIDHMPIVIAVQADKSDNLVRNIENESFVIKSSSTIADSISVDIPRNFHMAKNYISKYRGEWLSISDKDILEASSLLSKKTGLFAEPAAAAAFAGLLSYQGMNNIPENSNNIVLLTGSGLKDLGAVGTIVSMPKSINPTMEELDKLLT